MRAGRPLYGLEPFPISEKSRLPLVVFYDLPHCREHRSAVSNRKRYGWKRRENGAGRIQPEFEVLINPKIDMRRVLSDGRAFLKALGASEFQAICRPLLFLNT